MQASPSALLNSAGGASSQASWSSIMMSQTSSYSRLFVAWLVLVTFLCALMVPSFALARMEMTIALEGDPGDGMDHTGGGGGGSNYDGDSSGSNSFEESRIEKNYFVPFYQAAPAFWSETPVLIPLVNENGKLTFVFIIPLNFGGMIR